MTIAIYLHISLHITHNCDSMFIFMLQIDQNDRYQSRVFLVDGGIEVGGAAADLYLEAMGRFDSRGSFDYRQMARWVAVHAIAEGRGTLECEGRSYTAGAGDLFVFFPGQHVHYFDLPGSPWRYTWFVLGGRHAEGVLGHCGITRTRPHRGGGLLPIMESIFREVETEYGRDRVSPTAAVALAWRLVHAMEPTGAPSPRPGLAERARLIFDHHYGEPLTVESIAERLGVSRATLFRAFHAEYGASPKAVLDGLRLERARGLLRASDYSIKEIAASCGYANEAYFSRAFKARTGLPPGRWRRSAS